MACEECEEKFLVRAGLARLQIPLRRLIESPDSQQGELKVGRYPQPTIQVADLSYSFGSPGWRGLWALATSPAVAARRSTFLFVATGGAFRVEHAQASAGLRIFIGPVNSLRPLLANVASIPGTLNTSGEADGGPSTVQAVIGDLDVAAPYLAAPTTPVQVNVPSATEPFLWMPGWKPEIPKQQAIAFIGSADNSARTLQIVITEYKDWA